MTGTVIIGQTNVGMTANAASPFLFRDVFHIDFLREVQKGGSEPDPQLFVQMGYIMHLQHDGGTAAARKGSIDDFYTWLESFGPVDMITAAQGIVEIYTKQERTLSDPKRAAK